MNGITLFMAFVDAIPVVVFLFAALAIMKDFAEDVSNTGLVPFASLCSGAVMLFSGAILKVAWKTMYALNICDYTTFSESFFPMQTLGFILLAAGVLGYIKKSTVPMVVYSVLHLTVCAVFVLLFSSAAKEGYSPEVVDGIYPVFVYESHMPFLLGTFIGFMAFQILMIVLAFKRKAKVYSIAFLLSMVFMIVEAVVGSMFDGTSGMHWVAQFVHLFAEIALLIGAKGIYKKKETPI